MHPDERRIYIALLAAGCLVTGLAIVFVANILRYRRHQQTASLLTLQQELRIQEMERSRVAADLHDELNSILSAIKLRLTLLSGDRERPRLLTDINGLLDSLTDKVRAISNQLLPVVLERQGLHKALEELIAHLADTGLFEVEYKFDPDCSLITREAGIQIYRIFQEIINNISKHSNATVVSFSLLLQKEIWYLRAQDNGIGFDRQTARKGAGIGLQSIRMRADVLQAKLFITTQSGRGVLYEIEFPAYAMEKK